MLGLDRLEQLRQTISYDTSLMRTPRVGDRFRSFVDVIELVYVSRPLHNGRCMDRAVAFKVIQSSSDPEADGDPILYGDLISMGVYSFVNPRQAPVNDFDQDEVATEEVLIGGRHD